MDTVVDTVAEPKKRRRKVKGVFQMKPGCWYVRYSDCEGNYHREPVGEGKTKQDAINLYQARKVEAKQGTLPEHLQRRKKILFREIAADALVYSATHKPRSHRSDKTRMSHLVGWFGDVPADAVTAEAIESH